MQTRKSYVLSCATNQAGAKARLLSRKRPDESGRGRLRVYATVARRLVAAVSALMPTHGSSEIWLIHQPQQLLKTPPRHKMKLNLQPCIPLERFQLSRLRSTRPRHQQPAPIHPERNHR